MIFKNTAILLVHIASLLQQYHHTVWCIRNYKKAIDNVMSFSNYVKGMHPSKLKG